MLNAVEGDQPHTVSVPSRVTGKLWWSARFDYLLRTGTDLASARRPLVWRQRLWPCPGRPARAHAQAPSALTAVCLPHPIIGTVSSVLARSY